LSGPQGELQAGQIQLFLSRETMRAERVDARTDVTIRLDTRVATGDHLAYDAADERYVITGRATVPVRIVDACRTTTGRTVTFFKASDRIIVDGNEEVRTESSRDGAPCPQATTP
jgi:lipopolysaccharide export system protein LptA